MIVDAHLHLWADDTQAYPWRPIHGSSPPAIQGSAEFVLDVLDEHGVDAAVAVQPRAYGDDHRYLADSRARFADRILAVAALDPRLPGSPAALESLSADGFVGVRLDVMAWGAMPLVDGTVLPLWDRATDLGLSIEVLILPEQLEALRPLAIRTPGTRVVIEHAARYGANPSDGPDAVCRLAPLPNVSVKVSALAAISGEAPPHRDLWPWLQTLYERFGPDRLMWGSDMPWIGATGYGPELAVFNELTWLDEVGRRALLGETAAQVFGFRMDAASG